MFKRKSLLATPLVCAAFFILIGGLNAAAQNKNLPPLIDRELLFGNPEIAGAQISPDGKFIAFLKPHKDTLNVWVKRAEDSFDKAKLITNRTDRPVTSYFWSRDGKYIMFVQDKGGDENFNVYAVNPNDSPKAGEEVATARNLTTSEKKVRAFIYRMSKSDPDLMFVGINDRDASWHDLYKVKISTGERTLIRENTERLTGWTFDNKDVLRLASRTTADGTSEILRVDDGGKFTKIYECTVFESCGAIRFHKDNARVYMTTNKGSLDLEQLVLFDAASGKEELVEADPKKRVDFGGAIFSKVSDELVGTAYEDERSRIYWRDKAFEADYKLVESKLPNKDITFGSSTDDEKTFLVSASSDTEPGETYLFDRRTKKLTLQYKVFDKIPRESLANVKSVSYKSSDGLEIPAFLTLPKGMEAKNLPVVMFIHGGPWARDNWGYDTFAQFLANRGYAVLQPNFRSSTGYGKKFLNAGNKQWGQLMQDDITWGAKYLVKEGIADEKKIAIMGGSYGGYATLAGVAFTPEVYAAGVAIVAPSNLITLLESIPPYWEAGRVIFHERMGNPNTPEGKAQLMKQSPLNSADKIKTPLMVVQGANDPRVNKRESDQIVIALRDRNFPVEYIVAPDEGHGFARPVNNMAMIAAAERFLAKHLGGRFQESMTPAVTTRLKEITVDPKTVTIAKAVDAKSLPAAKPANPIRLEKSNFAVRIEVGGNVALQFVAAEEIKEENGNIVATSSAKLPQGEINDITILDKTSYAVKKRTINQAGQITEYEIKDGKASGTAAGKALAIDLGGDLFADGAGSYSVVASLPLAEGYATTFRNIDMQKMKVEMKSLKVVGMEKVKVPAGEFDAFKVEITSADGTQTQTIWVDKATRKAVKAMANLPQFGGATIISELQ